MTNQATLYQEAFNAKLSVASPILKEKIAQAKINPDIKDRDVDAFVASVIEAAETQEEKFKKV